MHVSSQLMPNKCALGLLFGDQHAASAQSMAALAMGASSLGVAFAVFGLHERVLPVVLDLPG